MTKEQHIEEFKNKNTSSSISIIEETGYIETVISVLAMRPGFTLPKILVFPIISMDGTEPDLISVVNAISTVINKMVAEDKTEVLCTSIVTPAVVQMVKGKLPNAEDFKDSEPTDTLLITFETKDDYSINGYFVDRTNSISEKGGIVSTATLTKGFEVSDKNDKNVLVNALPRLFPKESINKNDQPEPIPCPKPNFT